MLHIDIEHPMFTAEGQALLRVKLNVQAGELVCLQGASGSGKTTLLRILAGLIKPLTGSIQFGDNKWYDSNTKRFVSARLRRTGLMFQDYALFPNMNVLQQLQYAQAKRDPEHIQQLLNDFGLITLSHRKPQQLSGGQKQRVALARALASRPSMLLLDEPFSALDQELKQNLRETIRQAHKLLGTVTLLVSHDPEEIQSLATSILHFPSSTLHPGRIFTESEWVQQAPSFYSKNNQLIHI
ncbi:MAG: ABC transporter ATP-binding protein [Bacteroidales bacterium]